MESGDVYSWGDPRYQSLGRRIVGDDSTPADKPGIVDALAGVRMAQIASGGWMSAAVSEDHAMYLWGAGMPGSEKRIRCLPSPGEVGLVCVAESSDGEPLDVVDVSVGDGHVAAVAADGERKRIFIVGDNKYGQLGAGSVADFVDEWSEIVLSPDVQVQRVVCGSKATFITTAPSDGQ
ncbi:hypothetical protein BAUCODRAFT_72592 [Baudoinia panamericana UAMH 10762]|uniref:Uncharacterized protein n=1 Tax=Baudoinia panamericana (strain UAMH 10762) TaxID=717646 RepID=M2N764_BAUPA|nr:uncharacterized protein BAUCODRAFT_72592 [Baudoinia panamericana UAMH 10762]EMC94914.1 hypothetical protein BAUCODRAFT_72592 [Baudoinia panamericana UAMH 10762]